MDEKKRYAYKPSATAALLGVALFAGGAFIMCQATQSDDSLSFAQVFTLPADQAKPVLWLFTIACVLIFALFLLGCYRILSRRGDVILDAGTLTVPPSPFASGLRT